ncbi:MAG: HK97 family phage prohead protease [Alphaproteobacteria bacterium]|nr:HK97 family phage prohead protease [Alphaproteobacteria bacterium]
MKPLLHGCFSLATKSVGERGQFEGYASIFALTDRQQDQVMPGAFRKSLIRARVDQNPPKLLWQHDPSQVIGVWQEVREDQQGLYVRGQLLMELPKAQEAYVLLKSGAIDGLSIGYEVVKAMRDRQTGIRHLLEVSLWEISLVTFAANQAARVTAVKGQTEAALAPVAAPLAAAAGLAPMPSNLDGGATIQAAMQSPRLFEKFLRDAGFSRRQAVALTNHGWLGLKSPTGTPRDAVMDANDYRQLAARLRQAAAALSAS